MSDYTKTTNFTAKDSLPNGDSNKVILGAEHDTEYSAIATAIASKADDADLTTLSNTVTTLTTTVTNQPSPNVTDGRLTLTTAVPVTTSDVTAATTLYYTPYIGNRISLYDGSGTWNQRTFTELSIAVPATTATMYDVFCYDNGGTATLELTSWTNDTTRATALTRQNGVLVKTGATTRKYLGSFRTTAVSGQTEDSVTKRYIWNYYNQVNRLFKVTESTDFWSVNTNTAFRQANANSANQFDLVCGVAENTLHASLVAIANGATSAHKGVGIGVDSTTVNSAISFNTSTESGNYIALLAELVEVPSAGRHYYAWLERTSNASVQFFGTGAGPVNLEPKSGFVGTFLM